MDLTRTFVAFHCLDFVLQVAGEIMIAKHLSTSFDCQQNSPIIELNSTSTKKNICTYTLDWFVYLFMFVYLFPQM